MNPPEIEKILRSAPVPPVPEGLQDQLTRQARRNPGNTPRDPAAERGWFRRGWPIFAWGGAALACASTLLVQQMEIRGLQESLQAVQSESTSSETPDVVVAATAAPTNVSSAEDERAEIARLTAEIARLRDAANSAGELAAENQRLKAQLTAASGLSAEDLERSQAARERAESIRCVNNMKNIGLALRIFATDNGDRFPPDILSMTNELSTPKILVCPADFSHKAASDWGSFTAANLSYEFLALGTVGAESEPSRVAVRCLIHGNIGLCDGSVQMSQGDGSNLLRRLVNRNGKLYLE